MVEFPDMPSFKQEHLPSMFLKYKESDPDYEIVKEGYLSYMASWGCVFNSFYDLEGTYFDYLRTTLGQGGFSRLAR